MFSRRTKRSLKRKIREFIWPSMGIARMMRYYKHRIGRLPGTPNAIASGFATGVAVSFTPFVGFHLLMGLAICWAFRFSVIGMVLGTVAGGNPWTFPLIWIGTYQLGNLMVGKEAQGLAPEHLSFAEVIKNPIDLLLPMSLGSLPFFFCFWCASFFLCRHLLISYRGAAR